MIKKLERAVIDAAVKEARCRCYSYQCKHLEALWDAAEALSKAMRRKIS